MINNELKKIKPKLVICIVILIRCEVELPLEFGVAYDFMNGKMRITKPDVIVSTHPWWALTIGPEGFRWRSIVIQSNASPRNVP